MTTRRPISRSAPLTLTEAQYLQLGDDYIGVCRSCRNEQGGCEPDARDYPCSDCGAMDVYGTEELLMRGEIEIV